MEQAGLFDWTTPEARNALHRRLQCNAGAEDLPGNIQRYRGLHPEAIAYRAFVRRYGRTQTAFSPEASGSTDLWGLTCISHLPAPPQQTSSSGNLSLESRPGLSSVGAHRGSHRRNTASQRGEFAETVV